MLNHHGQQPSYPFRLILIPNTVESHLEPGGQTLPVSLCPGGLYKTWENWFSLAVVLLQWFILFVFPLIRCQRKAAEESNLLTKYQYLIATYWIMLKKGKYKWLIHMVWGKNTGKSNIIMCQLCLPMPLPPLLPYVNESSFQAKNAEVYSSVLLISKF